MKILKRLLLLTLAVTMGISVAAAAEEGSRATTTRPTVVSEAKFPITLGSSEYDLLTRILEFPAGAGNPKHKHGGHVLVTVLSGEMTLREKGTERIVKAGESWTENPGNVHEVVNAGSVTARVVACFLIPKGAEITTPVK